MGEFRSRFESSTSAHADGLRVGIAHAQAPERVAALEQLVRDVRPNAEIEHVTSLGAVVGTHAGPGTVGFFWFEDT
jgi:fatty acid-binding protein DegV